LIGFSSSSSRMGHSPSPNGDFPFSPRDDFSIRSMERCLLWLQWRWMMSALMIFLE
jgi:hypothetical protein